VKIKRQDGFLPAAKRVPAFGLLTSGPSVPTEALPQPKFVQNEALYPFASVEMKPHWSVLLIPTNFETKERATSFSQLNPFQPTDR
jgi:hypothetical protein